MSDERYNKLKNEASQLLGEQLQKFCIDNPEFNQGAESYLGKKTSLNRVQFYTGFQAGKSTGKLLEQYWKVPVLMENVMLKAYCANKILDGKKGMFANSIQTGNSVRETVGSSLTKEWYIDSLLNKLSLDLLDELPSDELRFVQRAYFTIGERISQGLRTERETLSVKTNSLDDVLVNFNENNVSRCVDYDLVYDYSTLVGYGLASGNYDIINQYEGEIPKENRFSYHIQAFNDLGDFCRGDDQFSDIKNGIVTRPGYLLRDSSTYREALYDPRFLMFGRVQERLLNELKEKSVAQKMREESRESREKIIQFWQKRDVNDELLFDTYSMMKNNKYFNELTDQKE